MCQPKGGERSEVKLDEGDETSHELAGLVAGREHEMEIYTVNGEKESEKVTIKKFTSEFYYNKDDNNHILFLYSAYHIIMSLCAMHYASLSVSIVFPNTIFIIGQVQVCNIPHKL